MGKAWESRVAMGVLTGVDSRGRLLIPAEIRKQPGFNAGDSVSLLPFGGV